MAEGDGRTTVADETNAIELPVRHQIEFAGLREEAMWSGAVAVSDGVF